MIRAVLFLVVPMLIECGSSQEPLSRKVRAVGSDETTIEKHPHIASVHSYLPNWFMYDCGGFIVSKTNIITACHCVNLTDASSIMVRVGSNYYKGGGTYVNIKNATCHPDYKFGTDYTRNDIAVIELREPLTYGPTIQKVELYNRVLGKDESLQQDGVQVGWGYQPAIQQTAWMIQELTLPIISKNQCKKDFLDIIQKNGEDAVFDDQICAGEKAKTVTKSACVGDSGSPLVIVENGIRYAIGVFVNIESNCERPTYPNIFSEIAYHMPWLKRYVKFDQVSVSNHDSDCQV